MEILQEVRESFLNQRRKMSLCTPPPPMNLTGCLALESLKCLSAKYLIIFVYSYHPITFRHQIQSLYFLRPGMLFNFGHEKV